MSHSFAGRSTRALVCTLFVAGLTAACVPSAPAATLTVTKLVDTRDLACDADCSLREAIDAANLDGTADTIVLPPGELRVDLAGIAPESLNASGDLDVNSDVTIVGAGAAATVIHALLPAPPSAATDRVFEVSGTFTDATFTDLTIAGGLSAEFAASNFGGGIRANGPGTTELRRVVIQDNEARGGGTSGYGGGIYVGNGRLVVHDSAIVGNRARGFGYGGGVFFNGAAARGEFVNVTFSGNSANEYGGAVYNNAADTSVAFVHVTVTGNSATNSGGVDAAGAGDLRFRSSIIAGNTATAIGQNCRNGAGLASDGGNVGDPLCGFSQPTDAPTLDAQLAAFGGAPIPVAEPLPGSLAIDRAVGECPATDARGVTRPQNAACDSGAAESPDVTAPQAGRLSIKPRAFRARAGRGASVSAKTRRGASVAYDLSEAATMTFTVSRRVTGRRKGKRCVTGRAERGSSGRRCVVYRRVAGSFTHAGSSGANKFSFTGRVRRRPLKPGRYRLSGTPVDAGDNSGKPVVSSFTVRR
ncbi:MAG: CSLREA domain-containing protein [Actinobacteria bacterium]|nr:CSLREA domain-containing protein [Actinomycetota bacterium]